MDTTLNVQGMHCDACKSLIRMEIDELGFSENVKDVDLTSENNVGFVALQNVDEEEVEKITEAIDSLGNYQVVK